MSRSFKKAPVFAITGAESEKADKQRAHQAQRAHFRAQMAAGGAEDFVEANVAHSDNRGHAKEVRKYAPELRVRQEGRALHVLGTPNWARSDREVHQVLAK